ncbi:MAG: TonB-dependent receptor domain-containing protein [Flavobacteriales bacterium]
MKNSVFLVIFGGIFLSAQEKNQIDSVILSTKKVQEISIGHPVVHIEHDFGQSLGDDLSIQTGAYFKEYGNGMLASISYRGLGAVHTGVFWEGIPINSGLTGQTDFNLLYTEGFNSVDFRTGGGGATFGSGAVGGSVHINNELNYTEKFKGEINQKTADFSTYATHLGVEVSDSRNALKATMYRLTSDNNYDYTYNKKNYTIENGTVEILTSNVTYQRKINNKNNIKLALHYALADRQLMESVGTTSNQKQKDINYNSVLSWLFTDKKYSHKLSQAFLYSKYQYFPDQYLDDYDFGETENWITKYDGSYKLSSKIKLGVLGQFKYSEGTGSNIGSRDLSEGFISIYGQHRYKKIKQSLTVSKGILSEFKIPFTFDYGIELNLKPIKLHGNITTNYRTPSFNDLYWIPGGNLNLKAEDGWATELGFEFQSEIENSFHFNFRTNVFYSKFNDWIVWQPDVNQGGLFSPVNIKNVESYGIELFSKIHYSWSIFNLEWNTNYTFLKSMDEEKDKQLIYTPKHKLNNQLQLKIKNSSLQVQHQFVDDIYTSSDNLNRLEHFNLVDAFVGYYFKISELKISTRIGVNNIFNEEYQLISGRAMPKQNYFIQININF